MADATITTRSPVELAQEVFGEVLNKRDADLLVPYWAEDIVEEFPETTIHGSRGMRDYFAAVFAAIPDFHMDAEHIVGDDETVFVKWVMTGTFTGSPWTGIEATGSSIRLHGMDCFTVRDGLIVHNHVIYDGTSFARQIGMLPAQDSAADRAMTKAFNARTRLRARFGR